MNELGIIINEETDLKELILSVYEVLKDDTYWHFFWEKEFIIVRFSHEYSDQFVDFILDSPKYDSLIPFNEDGKTTFIRKWTESSEYVKMFKEYFTLLFHMNTMMAVHFIKNDSYERETMKNILDRMVHSLMNMSFPAYIEDMGNRNPSSYESIMIANVAVDRAFYGGYMQYYADYIKDREDETK